MCIRDRYLSGKKDAESSRASRRSRSPPKSDYERELESYRNEYDHDGDGVVGHHERAAGSKSSHAESPAKSIYLSGKKDGESSKPSTAARESESRPGLELYREYARETAAGGRSMSPASEEDEPAAPAAPVAASPAKSIYISGKKDNESSKPAAVEPAKEEEEEEEWKPQQWEPPHSRDPSPQPSPRAPAPAAPAKSIFISGKKDSESSKPAPATSPPARKPSTVDPAASPARSEPSTRALAPAERSPKPPPKQKSNGNNKLCPKRVGDDGLLILRPKPEFTI
eukprot:TRINITY_DN14192_c0_g1_i1.p1 TRINITY_DN14192_c0_g1~~TRINITY_DN14192_c0_g1_i1.p1  ORF type:complete len:283 (+),score=50.16 TRINITY_DN14192_c0_g1_i1:98-946(+)